MTRSNLSVSRRSWINFTTFFHKKYSYRMAQTIISGIILSSLFGCSAQEKNPIYYKGREFTYQVEITQNSTILKSERIKLKVTDDLRAKIFTGGQTGIKYFYEDRIDSISRKPLVESTGVIDNEKRVFLHPPRFSYMAFAEIPPMPDISRNPEIGVSQETILDGIKGHGNLDGKEIKQIDKIVRRENIELFGKIYKNAWVIKGRNTNYLEELGEYKVTYWFDEKFGFIRMKYEKPNGEIVDLKLNEVTEIKD